MPLLTSLLLSSEANGEFTNGEFIALIDLEGFSITRGLPFSVIQEFFTHTSHYPFRLAAIYLINSNSAFNALWGNIIALLCSLPSHVPVHTLSPTL